MTPNTPILYNDRETVEKLLFPHGRKPRYSPTEYNQYITKAMAMAGAYVEEGLTLEQIGGIFNITRERVRQILFKLGITADTVREQRKEDHTRRHQEASLDKLLDRMRNAKPCDVCGGWNLRRGRTCSPECAEMWRVARYHLGEDVHERHRMSVAKWMVANCTNEAQVRSAKHILNDRPPPNRRYVVPGSRVARLLDELQRGPKWE